MSKRAALITAPVLPQPGDRVGFVWGPGEFPRDQAGIVMTIVTDRWGSRAVILMDDGTTRDAHGLTNVGIGCYKL